MNKNNQVFIKEEKYLNPKVDSPPFTATVAAAVPLQHYQVDPVHGPLGLSRCVNVEHSTICVIQEYI